MCETCVLAAAPAPLKTEQSASAYVAEVERERAVFEAAAEPLWERALVATGGRAAELYARAGIAAADEAAAWARALYADALARTYEAAFVHFARWTDARLMDAEAAKSGGAAEWLRAALEWIERHVLRVAHLVGEATAEQLRAIIAEGLREGESVDDIARRIRRDFPEVSRVRARLLTRTAVVAASNGGSLAGARATGLALEKVWIATLSDGRTRPTHVEAHGQRVPLDGRFVVGGYSADQPGDPSLPAGEVLNCRCCVGYVRPGEDLPAKAAPTSWRDERDARIRAAYPALMKMHGADNAFMEIAERELLSARQVRRIVQEKGRG